MRFPGGPGGGRGWGRRFVGRRGGNEGRFRFGAGACTESNSTLSGDGCSVETLLPRPGDLPGARAGESGQSPLGAGAGRAPAAHAGCGGARKRGNYANVRLGAECANCRGPSRCYAALGSRCWPACGPKLSGRPSLDRPNAEGRAAAAGARAHRSQGSSKREDPDKPENFAVAQGSSSPASATATSAPTVTRGRSPPRHSAIERSSLPKPASPRRASGDETRPPGTRRGACWHSKACPEDVAPLQRPCACRSLAPPPP